MLDLLRSIILGAVAAFLTYQLLPSFSPYFRFHPTELAIVSIIVMVVVGAVTGKKKSAEDREYITNPERDEDRPRRARYIPQKVRWEVWRRDRARCSECDSQERLEYDHLIPLSKGGSNTARNIRILCERCNRRKSANI